MRYYLLTGIALLLLGGETAQAQFYPSRYPYPPIKRHGFVPYSKPVSYFSLNVGRPVPVFPVAPFVVAPKGYHHSKYYAAPLLPVAPLVAPFAAPQFGLLPPQQIVPQVSPQQAAQVVTGWYRQFLQREPDAAGLQTHIQVVLTQGEDVALSGILGSDEYWQLCGQDARSWIVSLYVGVLNRQPAEDEIQHWYQVFATYGGDRQRTVLNFLPAARQEPRR
jgi:hypothetical protein